MRDIKQKTIVLSVVVLILLAIGISWALLGIQETMGQADTWGTPVHNHHQWPEQRTTNYTSSYTKHIQGEMNWLKAMGCFTNTRSTGDCSSGTELCLDGVYGTRTANWVRDFQEATGITVDGITGNQTWTQMETSVLFRCGPIARFPSGLSNMRILMWDNCEGRSYGSGNDIMIPAKTEAEWDSFKNASITNLSTFTANCAYGGGSGTGGGEPSASDPTTSCPMVCEDVCADYGCTTCSGCWSSQTCICAM